ncbi:hypothetical protein B6N58_09175 [Legionella micdadei]|uniref:hypothetical protein n=1 Tax=Legionella micdadei TaxID=451 RepID=UPI0009EF7C42|nr:hypothetical protein [Legionella micdadei]ARG97818.1 hypothetical protein B6N58_09175 [Legionella micdadei]
MPAQSKIINSVNNLLGHKGFSLKLNDGGVCAGLSSLFIKYFLKGELPEFFRLCKLLADPPKNYQIGQDEKFDKFILEVEIAFNPQAYNKNSNQGDLDKVITIDGAPLKNEYNIGLVESEINWAKILEQIHNNGRACYVSANKHAIGLAFENDQYIVFDPNYQEDGDNDTREPKFNIKTFNTATEVISELENCLFFKKGDIGFKVRVFAKPNASTTHQYPDKKDILANSLKDPADFTKKAGDVAQNTSLFFALGANDEEVLDHYLSHDQVSAKDIGLAIWYQRDAFVWKYFSHLADLPSQLNVLSTAAQYGTTSLLNRMLQKIELQIQGSEALKQEFKEGISDTEPSLLEQAALSDNLANLVHVVELYRKYGIKITSLDLAKRLFERITAEGKGESINYLTETKLLRYSPDRIVPLIEIAAKNDNRSTLQFWLGKLKKEGNMLNSLEIDAEMISKISPLNLKLLIDHGFTIKPALLRDALQHPSSEVFKIALKTQPETEWTKFLRAVAGNEPLDSFGPQLSSLFQDHDGMNAFEVLVRFERNRAIKQSEEVNGLSAQGKEKALEFACKHGNADLVHFLVAMDCKVSEQYKLEQLKLAATHGDLPRVNAILATKVESSAILPKGSKDYELTDQLIELGKYRFITDAWSQYDYPQQRRCLLAALVYNNKAFIQETIKDLPFCYRFIFDNMKDAYNKNQPSYLAKITPYFSLVSESDLTRFWTQALEKNDGKAICQFTLKYAILNHHFALAQKMAGVISLSKDDAYQLFVEASASKNQAALTYLSDNYAHLLASPPTYRRMFSEGQFELIALVLEKNKLPERQVCIELLNSAVVAHNQRVISRLASVINDYFRVEGSPLLKAIQEENATGAHLLLMHGAKLNDELLASGVFRLALKANNPGLLAGALKNKDFAKFFAQNEAENVEKILKSGNSDLVYVLSAHLNLNDYYEQFITYAIEHNDLRLFQMLQQKEEYASQDKEKLFLKACVHQSINIANALLRDPINLGDETRKGEYFEILLGENAEKLLAKPPYKNKTIQHVALKMLFGDKDAADIYELVYKKALNRLYLYIKEHKFPSALASLHRSVDELVFDPGFMKNASSGLRNNLIVRALNEGNAETFDELLKQLDRKPSLSDVGLGFFTKYLDKPLLRKVLLEHYKLTDVIDAAIIAGEWPVVIALLIDRKQEEFDHELITRLTEHSTELMEALVNHSKREIHSDPRHKLNALLLSKSTEVLSAVLKGKENEIEALIMAIQEQMVKEKIDLKHHFYEFGLYAQIMKEQKAYEEIQPRVREFFSENPSASEIEIQGVVNNELLRNEVMAIRDFLAKNNLVPGYFEERDGLVSVFDALDRHAKEEERQQLEELKRREEERHRLEEQKRKEEEDARRRLEEQKRKEEEDARRRLEEQKRKEEEDARRRLEEQKRKEEEDARRRLEEQKRKEEEDARRRLEEQKRKEEEDARRLLEEQKPQEEEGGHRRSEEQKGKEALQPGTKQEMGRTRRFLPNAIELLMSEVRNYRSERASEDEVFFTFLQYSRQDKLDASTHFIEGLLNSNRFISDKDRAALNNGRLFDRIDEFLEENKVELKRALHCNWELDSVDELIDFLNCRNPVNTLVWILEQYSIERNRGDEIYGWSLFARYQYTRKDKLDAAQHLISLLKGESEKVSEKDLGALKQGSLGRLIQSYIDKYGFALEESLGFDINDIEDIVSNRQHSFEMEC